MANNTEVKATKTTKFMMTIVLIIMSIAVTVGFVSSLSEDANQNNDSSYEVSRDNKPF